jgi:hypothetical protein
MADSAEDELLRDELDGVAPGDRLDDPEVEDALRHPDVEPLD